ncbi:MAG: DUF4870 domain-containing protein [Nesterenkonia sp.]|uniref:DUF4870 domain-containing protein n=1 Tax=Nesterenkonia marinintestina TaxID=2979865 RepID=UPI0021BE757D|nr:DUF4870 domain-containing protein [Nesterenkonia sp. GX14115]MDO5492130.1 DUF4870 domain-containing protein [Nesterenkonia sp.]
MAQSEDPSAGRPPRQRPDRSSSEHLQGSSSEALPLTPAEDRRWATLAHFGGLMGCVPSLIIFLIFRDRGPFTAQESKEALNFTLPLTVLLLASYILALIPAIGWIFGLTAVLIWIILAVSGLIAGIECNKGRPYRYRFNLRLIH